MTAMDPKGIPARAGTLFFSGIGGSGMSALAIVLAARGTAVAGSDRNHDRGQLPDLFAALRRRGIALHPQDGSGVDASVRRLVVSTAIESSNPDVRAAQRLGIEIVHRASLLAETFHTGRGIAVGGTSGKTTVTAMIGWIATCAGLDPTIVNGGRMKNLAPDMFPGNARPGRGAWTVIEADESDGSIRNYRPDIAIVTNISKDHMPVESLIPLFQGFADAAASVGVNADCPHSQRLHPRGRLLRFGFDRSADVRGESIVEDTWRTSFVLDGMTYTIPLPGRHNAMNALAAITAARLAGIGDDVSRDSLSRFAGTGRRFDRIGTVDDIDVIDDFAHNPDKIRATLASSAWGRRRFLVFQPHGFGPVRFLLRELVAAFTSGMAPEDHLYVSPIYYAGGSTVMDVSGADIADGVAASGLFARHLPTREAIAAAIVAEARAGDLIIVMGARDDTLTSFCERILRDLKEERVGRR